MQVAVALIYTWLLFYIFIAESSVLMDNKNVSSVLFLPDIQSMTSNIKLMESPCCVVWWNVVWSDENKANCDRSDCKLLSYICASYAVGMAPEISTPCHSLVPFNELSACDTWCTCFWKKTDAVFMEYCLVFKKSVLYKILTIDIP